VPGREIHTTTYPGGRRFQVVVYDLLDEPVDAIVNAANGGLAHGGGVAAAIANAAGDALEEEGRALVQRLGRIPVGHAVVTTAGNLPHKGVIHAVGPRMGDGDEGNKLVQALKAAFTQAHNQGWTSVSFPAVSSGIYAVPAPVCAEAYLRAVDEYFVEVPDTSLDLIRLCMFEGKVLDEVGRAWEKRHGS
jgi:O-acetyl-ADP-ribose deacetylase (regulator of RNase III)